MVLLDVAGIFFTVSLTLYLELNRPPIGDSLINSVVTTSVYTSFAGVCFTHFLVFLNNILYITVYDNKFYILIASSVTSALISKIVKIMYILSTVDKNKREWVDEVNTEDITADEVVESEKEEHVKDEEEEEEQEPVKDEEEEEEKEPVKDEEKEPVKDEEPVKEEKEQEPVKDEEQEPVKEEEEQEPVKEEAKQQEITSADSDISYFQ